MKNSHTTLIAVSRVGDCVRELNALYFTQNPRETDSDLRFLIHILNNLDCT